MYSWEKNVSIANIYKEQYRQLSKNGKSFSSVSMFKKDMLAGFMWTVYVYFLKEFISVIISLQERGISNMKIWE